MSLEATVGQVEHWMSAVGQHRQRLSELTAAPPARVASRPREQDELEHRTRHDNAHRQLGNSLDELRRAMAALSRELEVVEPAVVAYKDAQRLIAETEAALKEVS